MGWAESFILKGTVSQDEFFDAVRKQFAKRMSSIYKQEYNYPDGSKLEDTLELIISPLEKTDSVYLRLWLRASVSAWDAKPLCALIGPHWTEVGVEGRGNTQEAFDELKQWITDFYDGFLLDEFLRPLKLPSWFHIEIPDETVKQYYDRIKAEWFAETYGVTWPPPFPVGNPQVEANFEPDWSRKQSIYEPPPQLRPKRPKSGSKRQKPHGKRHER